MACYESYITIYDAVSLSDLDLEEAGISEDVLDIELEIVFDVVCVDKGRPMVMYLPNGDPGYPAEPAEYEMTLETNFETLLESVVSDHDAELLLPVLRNWLDICFDDILDDAIESIEADAGEDY